MNEGAEGLRSPRKYLAEAGIADEEINSLANFCFISSGDNKRIGKKAPSEYSKMMVVDQVQTLASNVIPTTFSDDNFTNFRIVRSDNLAALSITLAT